MNWEKVREREGEFFFHFHSYSSIITSIVFLSIEFNGFIKEFQHLRYIQNIYRILQKLLNIANVFCTFIVEAYN